MALSRAQLNRRVDLALSAAAAVVFATGLWLLVRFHAGPGCDRASDLGLSRLAWLNIHRFAAIAMLGGVVWHAYLHWAVIAARVRRTALRLPGRASRLDLVLYFGTAALLLAGFAAWVIVPGSTPLYGPVTLGRLAPARHVWIDAHNFSGLIALPAVTIHVKRHLRRLLGTRA